MSSIGCALALVFADTKAAKAGGRSMLHRPGTCGVDHGGAAIRDVEAETEQRFQVAHGEFGKARDGLRRSRHDSLSLPVVAAG